MRLRLSASPCERHLGQSEIQNLGVSTLGDEDICRLDVAMDNALGVGCLERVRNVDAQCQQSAGLQRPSGDAVVERQPSRYSITMNDWPSCFADFVDGADVGMVQRRRRPRFAAETFQGLRVFGHFFRQELQSDEAAEFGVFGLVDHTHAAAAEFLDHTVVRDGLPEHWRESYEVKPDKSMKVEQLSRLDGVLTIQGLWRCFSDSSIALRNCSTASTCGAFSESFAI